MKIGICSNCNKETHIVNTHFKLCNKCNDERLNKSKVNVSLNKIKPKKQYVLKRKPIKVKKKKPTGEREMFLEIWEERPHFCENLNCRKFLGHEPKVQYFSHNKPKSTHPELRLCKDNIDLLCSECHYAHEFQDKSKIKLNR